VPALRLGELKIEGVTAADLEEAAGGDLAGHLFNAFQRNKP
jgi:hypothetical protein